MSEQLPATTSAPVKPPAGRGVGERHGSNARIERHRAGPLDVPEGSGRLFERSETYGFEQLTALGR
jgi:hypothetical protein